MFRSKVRMIWSSLSPWVGTWSEDVVLYPPTLAPLLSDRRGTRCVPHPSLMGFLVVRRYWSSSPLPLVRLFVPPVMSTGDLVRTKPSILDSRQMSPTPSPLSEKVFQTGD